MSIEDIRDKLAAQDGNDRRNKLIGVYVGVLAVLLAICTMAGGNAAKDATQSNIAAANLWAFFQAKNLRRTQTELTAEGIEAMAQLVPTAPEDARAAVAAKVAAMRKFADGLRSDPKTNEGLDQLFQRAKALEADRDLAMRKDPYFDYAQALLQIAIVLASVAIVSGGTTLLGVSAFLGAMGTLLLLNGLTLAFRIPFIG